ncbi:MAG: arginase family protein, partial [Gemmatimonadales bacterium]
MNDLKGTGAMDGRLGEFDWAPITAFLGVPAEPPQGTRPGTTILPVPYEATVSYMPGTKFGPAAIIEASKYVELYDHEVDSEPYLAGIKTLPELLLGGSGPEEAHRTLRRVFDLLLEQEDFVLMLGGEHSITSAAVLAHADRRENRLSVLQFDAHADLRAEYDGTAYSHASVMHRVHEAVDMVPVGIRSLTAAEMDIVRTKNVPMLFGHELDDPLLGDRVMEHLGPDVYITFDVDYFDPSLVPATGTPEPGGGQWYPTLEVLDRVF